MKDLQNLCFIGPFKQGMFVLPIKDHLYVALTGIYLL